MLARVPRADWAVASLGVAERRAPGLRGAEGGDGGDGPGVAGERGDGVGWWGWGSRGARGRSRWRVEVWEVVAGWDMSGRRERGGGARCLCTGGWVRLRGEVVGCECRDGGSGGGEDGRIGGGEDAVFVLIEVGGVSGAIVLLREGTSGGVN